MSSRTSPSPATFELPVRRGGRTITGAAVCFRSPKTSDCRFIPNNLRSGCDCRITAHIAAMHNALATLGKTDLDHRRVKVLEAIARSVLLRARYNGQALILAPHALFARRGELFLSALNLTKNWRAGEERRLGYFKLAGLASVDVLAEAFDPLPCAEALVAQIGDELVLSVR